MTQSVRLLLVDDDPHALASTRRILEHAGYDLVEAHDGEEALAKVREDLSIDVVVTDIRMPRMNGMDLFTALRISRPLLPVVLMTAFGKVEEAVQAMRMGACDFLTKPFKRQTLLDAVTLALRGRMTRKDSVEADPWKQDELIGSSVVMRELRKSIRQVASSRASVLITGESGVGKEKVARAIHAMSARAAKPFVDLNCAAIPENLMESELFGFEKGSFSGAVSSKAGLFEAAHQGTVFLDEIGDMPLALQSKLLRVLQGDGVRRLGSHEARSFDFRVISATHRNLREMGAAGTFREDLRYRLEVVALTVPPLRERPEDIPDLASFFLKHAANAQGKAIQGMDQATLDVLLLHPWPGNVRELSNVMERAVVFCDRDHLEIEDLPAHLLELAGRRPDGAERGSVTIPIGTTLKAVEELLIRRTLEATDGDKNMTARLLGIHSRTISRRLESHEE